MKDPVFRRLMLEKTAGKALRRRIMEDMKPKITDNSKLIFQSNGQTIDVNGPVGKTGELTRRG